MTNFSKRQFLALLGGSAVAGSAVSFGVGPSAAAENTIRTAVLATGTVNWEMNVIQHNGLDTKHGFALDILEVANNEATRIALQAGDVDLITSDWLLVARERAEGSDLTFVPFSSSVGAIMARPESGIKTLADLKGKKLGIAGGPLDKNWLLLQGMAQRDHGISLMDEVEVNFGAPPLLNEKAEQGEFDAVLNYWHFCARLAVKGFDYVVTGDQAAQAMGAKSSVAAVGYVFSDKWAAENPELASGFVAASREAKELLRTSDAEWERIRPMMRAEDDKVFLALRDRFREGIPSRPLSEEIADAEVLLKVLAELGGKDLVGDVTSLPAGTYWPGAA